MSAGTEEVNASLSLVSETATDVKKETLQTVNSIQSQAVSIEQISIQSNKMKEKVEELTELVSKFNITEQKG
ncbi:MULTISPECIES: hypothetical protein [Bacillus cereus group]|nr:hypothetical protein AXW78_15995 [Bacillus thuringiensis]ANP82195.1 hypothetical protein BAQ53_15550 [Bacillus sp. B25(2016b)]EEM82853.1 Methyl-accepting chemotaxis protein [Bacillus thuringiensis serovar huazhongensis BGSC 4BD1]EJR21796.1 hypothetical protein IIA_03101 [Bacillus cereus VD014]EJR82403.1 hypothetical protein IK7_02310 [Bacillus cereus VD156]KLA28962.1 hypothetical protein B4080_3564 [Bacillus cereus]